MSGPKQRRGKQIPGKVREAFDLALKRLASGECGNKIELADLWQEMLTQDPFRALDTLAKFCPREMLIEQETTHRIISGEPMPADQWEKQYLVGEAIETTH